MLIKKFTNRDHFVFQFIIRSDFIFKHLETKTIRIKF